MGAPAEQTFEISSPQENVSLEPFVQFPIEDVETSIPDRFEKIVRQYPDRLAVKMGDRALTYDELNQAANRLAHAILDKRGPDNEPIALLFEHGIDGIIALLGVLKGCKSYVFLDATFPAERIRSILRDSRARLIVVNNRSRSLACQLQPSKDAILNLEKIDCAISTANPRRRILPQDMAAIIYTSGSTGSPKGVVVTHGYHLNYAWVFSNEVQARPEDRVSLLHSLSFSSAIVNLVRALLNGSALFPFDFKTEGIDRLEKWLSAERITIFHSPPALFRQLANVDGRTFADLRIIELSGAPITTAEFDAYKRVFSARTLLEFQMGSTEAGTITSALVDQWFPYPSQGFPIGYACPGRQISLIDENGHEVAQGEAGEIAVSGRHLASGYWNNPELTKARFLPAPGGDERIFLTGDLGQMMPDGLIVHRGRKDFMIKIRGYRVEIGEVERTLSSHRLVMDAAVVAWDRKPGEKYLVAYIVSHRRSVLMVSDLRMFLYDRLPDYMIPSAFVFLESLPLTNGKLDRRSLPEPDHLRPQLKTRYVSPRSELEQRLVELWEEILDVCPIGVDDDFFDLGGYSLLGAKLIEEIKDRLQVELPLRLLGEQPTIAQLAAQIAIIQDAEAKPPKQDQGYKYLVKLQSARGTTPVFCLSHAGNYRGDLLRFAQLNRLVGGPYCFYGIQARGADGLSQPHDSVAEMAAAYVEEIRAVAPRGPYYLIGECGAAPIAYETAQQLQASTARVALLVLLDAKGFDPKTQGYFWRSYIWHRYFPRLSYLIHSAAQSQTLRRIRQSAGIRVPELCLLQGKQKLRYALLNSPRLVKMIGAELAQRTTAAFALNDSMHATRFAHALTRYPLYRMARLRYKYRPYAGKITVIANEAWRNADPNLGWPELAVGGLEIHTIAGNHDTYITENVGTVARVLADCLERAETGRRA